jgi:nucleoid-associated protein YgaU
MANEKPVGLIVGLLLIIGFGLILSMLMGTEDKRPPASAATEENPYAYASAHAIDDSARFTPVLDGAGLSTAVAGVGSPGGNSMVESRMAGPNMDDREGVIESEWRPGTSVLAATGSPAGGVAPPLRPADTIAAAAGHTTFYMGPNGITRTPPAGHVGGEPEAARGQTYVVQPGDTLTRIARKIYGAGKDREYKRIFEANRGAMRSESDLSIGQELIIPPLPAPAAASASSASAPLDGASGRLAAAPADRAAGTPSTSGRTANGRYATATLDDLSGTLANMGRGPATAAGRAYVVQRGDRLITIARRMMNDDSPAAVRKLYEANRGVLDSPDRLKIGVELKLP